MPALQPATAFYRSGQTASASGGHSGLEQARIQQPLQASEQLAVQGLRLVQPPLIETVIQRKTAIKQRGQPFTGIITHGIGLFQGIQQTTGVITQTVIDQARCAPLPGNFTIGRTGLTDASLTHIQGHGGQLAIIHLQRQRPFESALQIAGIETVGHTLHLLQQAGQRFTLAIIKLTLITLLPVSLGMLVRARATGFAHRMNRPVKIVSGILLFLIILAAILNNKEIFVSSFRNVGPVALSLNLFMLFVGYFSARLFRLDRPQRITISVESGIQNGTLGITIASTLLHNDVMAISPAIYSLIMFMTAGGIIAWANLGWKTLAARA